MSPLIAKNITCVRGERVLFQDLNIKLHAGELLQVVGDNGVGKSSLLRILAGLLVPESGEVISDQECFYLGHALSIKSELTVSENIGCSNIEKILQMWSLEQYENQLCKTLSQGQRQRVALARLSLSPEKWWILDEPFAHLDAEGVLQLEKLLQLHLDNQGMIVMSSHREMKNFAHMPDASASLLMLI